MERIKLGWVTKVVVEAKISILLLLFPQENMISYLSQQNVKDWFIWHRSCLQLSVLGSLQIDQLAYFDPQNMLLELYT